MTFARQAKKLVFIAATGSSSCSITSAGAEPARHHQRQRGRALPPARRSRLRVQSSDRAQPPWKRRSDMSALSRAHARRLRSAAHRRPRDRQRFRRGRGGRRRRAGMSRSENPLKRWQMAAAVDPEPHPPVIPQRELERGRLSAQTAKEADAGSSDARITDEDYDDPDPQPRGWQRRAASLRSTR